MNAYELAKELRTWKDDVGTNIMEDAATMLEQLDETLITLYKLYDERADRIAELEKENNRLQDHMTELRKIHTERIEAMEKALMLAGETKWDIVVDGKIIESNYAHPVKQLSDEEDGYFLPMSKLNKPMQDGIKILIDAAKRARWTNAVTRKDGVETTYEADWIKSLVPVFHPVKKLSDEEIDEIIKQHNWFSKSWVDMVRAIERKITNG